MNVLKKSGQYEPLDISKITKQTEPACEGLGLSYEELEIDANISFVDGMKTEDIQAITINTAKLKVDVDAPNWTFAAARLSLYDLYHKIRRLYGSESTKTIYQDVTLQDYIAMNRDVLDFDNFDGYDFDLIESSIVQERDYLFNSQGIETLLSRYVIKNKDGEITELPQHLFMCLAMWLAKEEEDKNRWTLEFYNIFSKLEFLPGTPTLSNGRIKNRSCFSCFVGSAPDDLTGIFKGYGEQAEISKLGGGIGWDFSRIRAQGAPIQNVKNAAGGVVPWLKIENDIGVAVDQLGTRAGAINCTLECWHKDFPSFLDMKKTTGDERLRTEDLFITGSLPDLFMERIEEKGTWTLFDPYDVPELPNTFGSEFEEHYLNAEARFRKDPDSFANIPVQMKAKDLMKKFIIYFFERGVPFTTFKDTVNRGHKRPELGIIRSGNLCQEFFNPTNEHEISVCNLGSINLSKVYSYHDLQRVLPVANRLLDNVIDISHYPVQKAKDTQLKRRSIGLGVCGEGELMANNQIYYGTTKHFEYIEKLYEDFRVILLESSRKLAIERGPYAPGKLERNAYLSCIAPTSSIAILMGTTNSHEPAYGKKWFEENIDGNIPFVAPGINASNYQYYQSAYEVDQFKLIEATGIRQSKFDMGISHNVYLRPENVTVGIIYKIIKHAWKHGLKSLYYLRSASQKEVEIKEDKIACFGCEG